MIVTYYIKKRSDGGAMKEILVFFLNRIITLLYHFGFFNFELLTFYYHQNPESVFCVF